MGVFEVVFGDSCVLHLITAARVDFNSTWEP